MYLIGDIIKSCTFPFLEVLELDDSKKKFGLIYLVQPVTPLVHGVYEKDWDVEPFWLEHSSTIQYLNSQ